MKNAKKILASLLVFILAFALVFTLASCNRDGEKCDHVDDDGDNVCDKCGKNIGSGTCDHVDDDGDNVCDKCGKTVGGGDVSSVLELISNGTVNFNVVKTADLKSAGAKKATTLVKELRDLGLVVSDVVSDNDADAVSECEIIIGSGARLREGCNVDYHSLGKDGYVIKVVGKRVIIAGGTDSVLCEAVDIFREKVLGITASTTSLADATVSINTDTVYERGSEYPLLNIKLGEKGSLMKGYYLSYDAFNSTIASNAYTVRSTIYNNSGLWLPLASELPEGESAEHLFVIREVDDAGDGAFRVYVDKDDNLIMECSFLLHMERGVRAFLDQYIEGKTGVSRIYSGDTFEYTINVVRYTEFGAVGNGKADDFKAIKATHEYANQYGIKVLEDEGLTYYIGSDSVGSCISIETDVDFGKASFIVDDTKVKPDAGGGAYRQMPLFSVSASSKCLGVKVDSSKLAGLSWTVGETTNLGLTFDGPQMLAISSNAHKIYIRWGANENGGSDVHENLIVDADGNVDPTTPLTFTYPHVTSVTAYSIEETPITIQGGTFTTKANQLSYEFDYPGYITGDQYYYYSRNFNITRSNTTIQGVKHRIEGEEDHGYPYSGFFSVSNCYNVTVKDCEVQGHKAYIEDRNGVTDSGTTMGSYDLSVAIAINCNFINIKQINSITSHEFWGIMGSNYARNVLYDGCYLSRFDAHCGVYNAKILNTTIGHTISITGDGEFYAENVTKLVGSNLVDLRADYGSTWHGTIKLKNIHMAGYAANSFSECNKNSISTEFFIVNGQWNDWEFGHDTYLPSCIELDGFSCEASANQRVTVNMLTYRNLVNAASSTLNPTVIDPNMYVKIDNIDSRTDVYMATSVSDYINDLFKSGAIKDTSEGTKKVKAR